MSLLTQDLEVRSSGSPGRVLTERLEEYCLNLLRAPSAFGFAQLLQAQDPRSRQVLEELLEWTALDNDFLLIALVALAPELELIASRLSWGRPDDDTVSEVLARATEALRWTHELVEGERIDFVLSHAYAKARAEQRRVDRHNVPTTVLRYGYEPEERHEANIADLSALLSRAVDGHVISEFERDLIGISREDKKTLQDLAYEAGVTYDALRMRRARAEDRLRRNFYINGDAR
jgi:hypothetical protein